MPSLREALETAYDAGAAPAAAAPAEPAAAPPAAEAAPAAEPSSSSAPLPIQTTNDLPGSQSRDPQGRFAKVAPTTSSPPASAPGATPQGAAPYQPPPAPSSWTEAARTKWAVLPPEVHAEIDKREKDMRRGMEEGAQHRQWREQFERTLGPYRPHLDPQNPLGTIEQALQAMTRLRTAPPQERQALLLELAERNGVPIDPGFAANLIRRGKVDIAALDGLLAGEPAHAAPQALDPEQLLQQAEERVMARFQREHVAAQVAAFEANPPEHYREVAQDMVRLAKAGFSRDPKALYDAACWQNESIRAKMIQAQLDERAKTANVSTQQARAAGMASPRPQPAAPPSGAKPAGLRGHLEAAFSAVESQ